MLFALLICLLLDFYPRSPCGERQDKREPYDDAGAYFYPRSPCGERPIKQQKRTTRKNFYPRSPCGERRSPRLVSDDFGQFLSTLSLRRATGGLELALWGGFISIHALLAESDTVTARIIDPTFDFYPRSPCGERHTSGATYRILRAFLSTLSLRRATLLSMFWLSRLFRFLSTLSLRRATMRMAFPAVRNVFLSTLSLRRATDDKHRIRWYIVISIHALLAESDRFTRVQQIWRAISIHALLAESDQGLPHLDIRAPDFYPRSPCGERRRRSVKLFRQNYISIHALLAESDAGSHWRAVLPPDFYPRSPCGERPLCMQDAIRNTQISIHALLAESDR